jgi:hypothetical protein
MCLFLRNNFKSLNTINIIKVFFYKERTPVFISKGRYILYLLYHLNNTTFKEIT